MVAPPRTLTVADVDAALGAERCPVRRSLWYGKPEDHGAGLPLALCASAAFALPCAVIEGRMTWEEWERRYEARSGGHPSAYAAAYARLEDWLGPDPVGQLRRLFDSPTLGPLAPG